ncbi:MAG: hypothetical protein ACXAEU_06790 [Candidatus Hodarchaeales archaeon]|jgi:excinuclease ABC subunit A
MEEKKFLNSNMLVLPYNAGAALISVVVYRKVMILCPVCKGARYNREVLEVKYKDKAIADVFNLSVEEALDFFNDVRLIKHKLSVMSE